MASCQSIPSIVNDLSVMHHHDDLIELRYTINNEASVHQLERVQNLYSPTHIVTTSSGEPILVREDRAASYSFSGSNETHGIVCTHMGDGTYHVSIHSEETGGIEIMHQKRFLQEDESERRMLFSDDDYIWTASTGGACDAILPPTFVADGTEMKSSGISVKLSDVERMAEQDAYRRVLFEADQYSFAPQCYPEAGAKHVIELGIVTDKAFYILKGENLNNVLAEIEHIVISSNTLLYAPQMNLDLQIGTLMMAGDTVPASWLPFFHGTRDGSCAPKTGDSLSLVNDIAQSWPVGSKMAHVHGLTGCLSSDNVLGVAYVDTLCQNSFNSGVSRYSVNTWRTFAHEVGHGFGAVHSFENGMGRTGGIMDYGNGKLLNTNVYRFNELREKEVCDRLSKAKLDKCPYLQRIENHSPSCGDGFLEGNEQCECDDLSTSCAGCNSCTLSNPALECSTDVFQMVAADGVSLGYHADCCVNGIIQRTPSTCNNGQGVCSMGQCINPCDRFSMDICGNANNGCRLSCGSDSMQCRNDYNYDGQKIGNVIDGTLCTASNNKVGVCKVGVCSSTSSPTSPTRLPTAFPTPPPVPTKVPTMYPTVTRSSPVTSPPTTKQPVESRAPSQYPTSKPTTKRPSAPPPTDRPTKSPTNFPSNRPSKSPTQFPTRRPSSDRPTKSPVTARPSTGRPTKMPTTNRPTTARPTAFVGNTVEQTKEFNDCFAIRNARACVRSGCLYNTFRRRIRDPGFAKNACLPEFIFT